jgi:hypothetical protein
MGGKAHGKRGPFQTDDVMTRKERMLTTLRGEPTDSIPWAPRLDLWYDANRLAGTLPPQYQHALLEDITDDLDFGYHAIIPRFKDLRDPLDEVHRALGIYNLSTMPYATLLENVDVAMTKNGDLTHVVYRTPVGEITTTVVYDENMRRAGISITHIAEYAIKSAKDYTVIRYVFDHARVERNEEGYREFASHIGSRGIAAGFLSLAASPMHLLQRELMPMEQFFYELHDHPEELTACAESIGRYWEKILDVASLSSADLFLLGANYDRGVTPPPFFREHILPWLKRCAAVLHPKNKFLLTHADGENTGLLDCYLDSRIDVADSICPAPMTKLTFKEIRNYFAGRITIMGGIPSICLVRDAMSDRAFEAYLDDFFSHLGVGDHLILGISDTTPPAAEFERLKAIGKRVREFGPVRPSCQRS